VCSSDLAISKSDLDVLINESKIGLVLTDPPYGVAVVKDGKVGADFGVAKKGKYKQIIGDDSTDTAIASYELLKDLSDKQILWGGNYYASALNNSSCWIVWDKKNNGSFADCELAWTNQTTAVRKFEHMWNGMIKDSERGEKRVHPTQKPVALSEWCFDNYGEDCATVLDLFGGSGSTLIACENKGKSCFMMELSENYNDVIIERWQKLTSKIATLESTGQTFENVKLDRMGVIAL
jgi:DNA modification methylase